MFQYHQDKLEKTGFMMLFFQKISQASFSGSILYATNASFVNNNTAVRALPFINKDILGNKIANQSSIKSSTFVVNNTMPVHRTFSEFIYLYNTSTFQIKGTSFLGEKIYSETITAPTAHGQIDTNAWPNGIYTYSLSSDSGASQSGKLIIQHP